MKDNDLIYSSMYDLYNDYSQYKLVNKIGKFLHNKEYFYTTNDNKMIFKKDKNKKIIFVSLLLPKKYFFIKNELSNIIFIEYSYDNSDKYWNHVVYSTSEYIIFRDKINQYLNELLTHLEYTSKLIKYDKSNKIMKIYKMLYGEIYVPEKTERLEKL